MGWLTPRLTCLAQVDSTNNWAKTHLAELSHLDAVYALSQTAGKGRLGRSWENAGEEALYYTIVCKTPLADPASLPLLASLAVAGALQKLLGLNCQIKWPNDLLAGGKKLCGILCESTPGGIVCGIGVNLRQSEDFFAAHGLPYATSAAAALAEQQKNAAAQPPPPPTLPSNLTQRLAEEIGAQFAALLPVFAQNGFAALRADYCRLCVNLGREVEFAGGRGVARDIDDAGRLVVETTAGETAVFTGEVSVRGIYGRV